MATKLQEGYQSGLGEPGSVFWAGSLGTRALVLYVGGVLGESPELPGTTEAWSPPPHSDFAWRSPVMGTSLPPTWGRPQGPFLLTAGPRPRPQNLAWHLGCLTFSMGIENSKSHRGARQCPSLAQLLGRGWAGTRAVSDWSLAQMGGPRGTLQGSRSHSCSQGRK